MFFFKKYKTAHDAWLEELAQAQKDARQCLDDAILDAAADKDAGRRLISFMAREEEIRDSKESLQAMRFKKSSPISSAVHFAVFVLLCVPLHFFFLTGLLSYAAACVPYVVGGIAEHFFTKWHNTREKKPFVKAMDEVIEDCNAQARAVIENDLAGLEASSVLDDVLEFVPSLAARFEAAAKVSADQRQNILDADKVALKEEIALPPKISPKRKTAPQPKKPGAAGQATPAAPKQ